MKSAKPSLQASVLGLMRERHPAACRTWFGDLVVKDADGGVVIIVAADRAQMAYLLEHCRRPFLEAAQAATGRLVTVRFVLPDGSEPEAAGATAGDDRPSFERDSSLLRIHGDYTFDQYVVGMGNRMAHASSMAVSESPGTVYNPLFIYGGVGQGKTHLLHAVCHRILDRTPAARVVYLSSETFMNHYIEAMEKGVLESFRFRYRHVDVLLIDDVQFLPSCERTQDEFFHTFNTLYQAHKQIVLSGDRQPKEIAGLEDRLISRFNWGLVLRIDPPCLETRLAIIRKKSRMRRLDLPDDVAMFLATRVKTNARELEGVLNRLHSMANLDNRPIDLALARECLGQEDAAVRRQVRIQEIMGIVTEKFDVKLSDLQGRRRHRSVALPRQVCMYLARQLTPHSLEEIGGFFGGRDHTTVMHANRLVGERRATDSAFHARLEEIESALRTGGAAG
jgi:chromosomal replication initiator protein